MYFHDLYKNHDEEIMHDEVKNLAKSIEYDVEYDTEMFAEDDAIVIMQVLMECKRDYETALKKREKAEESAKAIEQSNDTHYDKAA